MNQDRLPENWPLPEAYLLEMGRIFALWGSLESSINLAISKLAGYEGTLDWRAAVLTAHSNFQQRVDVLTTFCEQLQHDYQHLSEYKSVVEKIRKVQMRRNQYAHSSIYLNEESGKVQTSSLSARGKLKTKIQEVNLEELKQVSADIHEAMLDIHHLITQVRYLPIWNRKC